MQLEKTQFAHLMTPAVTHLGQVFSDAGFDLRIVGGAVRDLVQGIDPKDIDMSTDATPDQMMALFKANKIRFEPTGLQHGTLTVVLDGEPIEITTLRIDTDTDGRHAQVAFVTDWRLDAARRDLTFNAMNMTLDGVVTDFFGGIEDLQNGMARFVGSTEDRIQEDFLRILRFFRFQGRIENPTWDIETRAAIKNNAGGLQTVSGERVWMEMQKILSNVNTRFDVAKKMRLAGALAPINLPAGGIANLHDLQSTNSLVALSVMFSSVGEVDNLNRAWKLSSKEFKMVRFVVENMRTKMTEDEAKKMLSDPKVDDEHVFGLLEAQNQDALVAQLREWDVPEFPVTGGDLVFAGMSPGPRMGDTLNELREMWEQSAFVLTRGQLLEKLR